MGKMKSYLMDLEEKCDKIISDVIMLGDLDGTPQTVYNLVRRECLAQDIPPTMHQYVTTQIQELCK